MAIKSTGSLSFSSDIAAEFGDSAPYQLSDYYRGSGLVPDTAGNINVPASGPIAFSSFYNAAKIIPAVIPAGSIIFYDTTLAAPTPPAGWNLYTAGDNSFISATADQASIGTASSASIGSQTAPSIFSGTGGGHGNLAGTFTAVESMSLASGTSQSSPKFDGSHVHTIASTNISGRGIPYPPLKRLVAMVATEDQESLPSHAVIFRSTIPNATTWRQVTATENSAVMLGKSSSFNSGNDAPAGTIVSWFETSGTNGQHDHRATNTRGSGGGFTSTARSQLAGGNHTHEIIRSMTVQLRQKILKAWKTAVANIATDDFILLFVGNFSNLPSGWIACNGRDGAENLTGWIIGIGAAATAQGSTIATTQLILNSNLSQINPTHGHGPAPTSLRFIYAQANSYHSNAAWNHFHNTTNQVFTSGYSPPTIYLGFIQYKARLKQPHVPGDHVESQGGYYAGDIRYPDGSIYDLFIAEGRTPGHGPAGWVSRQWQTSATAGPLPLQIPGDYRRLGYDGAANTAFYAAAGGYPAAEYCANLVHNSKDDWYLPSIFELYEVFRNLKPTAVGNTTNALTNPLIYPGMGLTSNNYTPYRVGGNGTFIGTATMPAMTAAENFKEGGLEALTREYIWSSTPVPEINGGSSTTIDRADNAWALVFSWPSADYGPGRFEGFTSKLNPTRVVAMRKVLRP